MTQVPVVVTVVVTCNRKDLLLRCLKANLEQTRLPDRLVLVDNASADGTYERLSREGWLEDPRISYHRLDENLGGAGGFVAGMEAALALGAVRMWLMDDDAIPEPDALERLLEHAGDEADCSLLASQVLTAGGAPDIVHRVQIRRRPLWLTPVPSATYAAQRVNVDAVSFVGPLIHRRHVERCGLPRADYFLYYDDFEYSYRVRRAGFPVTLVPASRIVHLDQGRARRMAMAEPSWGWRLYYRTRNRLHFYRGAAGGLASLWFLLLFVVLGQIALIVFRQPHKTRRLRLLLRGVADGWAGRLGKTLNPADYRE